MAKERRRMTPEERAASKERANKKRRLRRLWGSDYSFEEICEEMGMTPDELHKYAHWIGLDERPEPAFYMPTPLEIRQATARIRMGWSQEERDSRLDGRTSDRLNNATGSE